MYQSIVIDGALMSSEKDFHRTLAEVLDFGPYYGNNTDALWDMLSSGMACGFFIHWKNSSTSKERLGEKFDVIVGLFNKTKQRYQGKGEDMQFDFLLN
ncbi:MAG: barstar family protein [Pantoea sp.]|uniref:barstar family protein n=1 Tax=Pantoea TaxID=53335 RepID=UPI000F88AFCF|nr:MULTISPECIES: barstar family protein [Pantoea]MDU6433239.1 barstar family protein [Pantoea sp.]RTY55125.1 barnase inhibitor [Pantoea sp. YU22]